MPTERKHGLHSGYRLVNICKGYRTTVVDGAINIEGAVIPFLDY